MILKEHDLRTLARLVRIDPQLLSPVKHRSTRAQANLTVLRARAGLVDGADQYGARADKVLRRAAARLQSEERECRESTGTEPRTANCVRTVAGSGGVAE